MDDEASRALNNRLRMVDLVLQSAPEPTVMDYFGHTTQPRRRAKRLNRIMVLRYGLVALVLGASGYLAVDTWKTNHRDDAPADVMAVGSKMEDLEQGDEMPVIEGPMETESEPVQPDEQPVRQDEQEGGSIPGDYPVRVSIPALGVNARVLNVGLDGQGNIASPVGIYDTGWYNGSARPGQEGAVFIDGHAGVGVPGIFARLGDLSAGAIITVQRADGASVNYSVKHIKTVSAVEVDMKEALSPYVGYSKGLNLMTCAGTYVQGTGTYEHRTIVFATVD